MKKRKPTGENRGGEEQKMKIRKPMLICLALCLMLNVFAGCGDENSPKGTESSIGSGDMATDPGDSDTTGNGNDPSENTEKKISIVKLESTGDVGFDKICYGDAYGSDGIFSSDVLDRVMAEMPDISKNDSGLIPFMYNGMGYINEKGEVVIRNSYTYANPFSEGKAFVSDEDGIHIIDTSGNVLFTFPDEIDADAKLIFADKVQYENGRATFYTNDGGCMAIDEGFHIANIVAASSDYDFHESEGWGTLQELGHRIINSPDFCGVLYEYGGGSPYFSDIIDLFNSDGSIIWSGWNNNISYSWLNALENTQISAAYSHGDTDRFARCGMMITVSGKYANVIDSDWKWGLMDVTTGTMVIDYQYDCMGAYADGVIPVCTDGKWGLIDIDGNQLIRNQYKYIGTYSDGVAFAIIDHGEYCLIDKTGAEICVFDRASGLYDQPFVITPFNDSGIMCFRTGSLDSDRDVHFISNTGEILLTVPSDRIDHVSNDYIVADGELYKITVQ